MLHGTRWTQQRLTIGCIWVNRVARALTRNTDLATQRGQEACIVGVCRPRMIDRPGAILMCQLAKNLHDLYLALTISLGVCTQCLSISRFVGDRRSRAYEGNEGIDNVIGTRWAPCMHECNVLPHRHICCFGSDMCVLVRFPVLAPSEIVTLLCTFIRLFHGLVCYCLCSLVLVLPLSSSCRAYLFIRLSRCSSCLCLPLSISFLCYLFESTCRPTER
jgi:hypothetical protein